MKLKHVDLSPFSIWIIYLQYLKKYWRLIDEKLMLAWILRLSG
jgi:hypothetical protein